MFARAVVEAFRDQRDPDLVERFSAFTEAEWADGLAWLDGQDTQCYFLTRIAELGLDQAIPGSVLSRMKERYAENEYRIGRMFDAFVRVNDCLQAAGITFCNLRGFALVPALRADPCLRRLPALELLVLKTEMQQCREILSTLGYTGSEISENVWLSHLKTVNQGGNKHEDSSAQQVQIRIHSVAATEDGEGPAANRMLMRRRPQMWKGYVFYAPSASDHLVAQVVNIESQIEKGSVVLADVLEFARCMRFWARAGEFWDEAVERSLEDPQQARALGSAAMAAARVIGIEIPAPLWQFVKESPGELPIPALERSWAGEVENSSSTSRSTSARARRMFGYPENDTPAEKVDDTQLLERICAAYIKTIEDASHYSREYGPSPWWESVERKNLSQIQRALRARDVAALRRMYRSFFRTASGTGLVRRPLEIGGSRNHFVPDEAELCVIREDTFYRVGYWRTQTDGCFPISALQSPGVGNPFGVIIDGTLIAAGAEFQHACAHRIAQMTGEYATVVEIGGGFGNMAYYLLKARAGIRYVDFDVPESLALTAYYLGKSSPGREMLLYGEADFAFGPATAYEIALMPPWMMGKLPDRSVDLTFSSHVLWDLIPSAREMYLADIARFTSGVLLDVSDEKDQAAYDYGRLFVCLEKRPSYWNLYRAPDAKEWERVLRPLR